MIENINNSLKAKLYENTSTSFIASFIISATLLNHKYLMIYFSSYDNLNEKLSLLEHNYLGLEFTIGLPLIFAFFYTVVFPFFHHWILEVSEKHKNKSKLIKITANGKKPIDDEEKKHLEEEIYNLKLESYKDKEFVSKLKKNSEIEVLKKEEEIKEKNESINKYIQELNELNKKVKDFEEKSFKEEEIKTELDASKTQVSELNNTILKLENSNILLEKEYKEYSIRLNELGNRNQELADENHNLVSRNAKQTEETENLKQELKLYLELKELTPKLTQEIDELKEKNEKLNNLLSTNNINVSFENEQNLSSNEIKVLKVLGENNYKSKSSEYENFITNIANWTNLSRILVEVIVPELINKKLINTVRVGNTNYVAITPLGKKTILEILNTI